MKPEKLLSWLTAAAFGFCIAMGGVGGMISGFRMDNVDAAQLGWFCLLFAVFAAGCFTFRWGPWVLAGGAALAAGFLLRDGEILDSVEAVLFRISEYYDSAYGWGLIQWSDGSPSGTELTLALCLIAALVNICVTWVVCRRKQILLAVIPGILPLAICFVVTDTVPDSGSLSLLMTSLLLLLLTQMGRRRSASDGLRQTALLLIPAILCTQLLFWAVPRESYRASEEKLDFWKSWLAAIRDRTEDDPGGAEAPEVYALQNVGPRTYRNIKIMDVTTDSSSVLYLRGQAYDQYNGVQWSVAELDVRDTGWPSGPWGSLGTVSIKVRSALPYQYFPYYPDSEGWNDDLNLGRLENKRKKKSYSYQWSYPIATPGSDENIRLNERMRQQCLQLPEETAAKARALHILPKGTLSPSQKAEIIGQYVRESAKYSLNTAYMPKEETDFAFWFLEESETGYCVHFATAATVLLRAMGIPARYVTGYTRKVEAKRVQSVMDNHAHAWVEYFAEGEGWKILDPTPAQESEPQPTDPDATTQPTQPSQTVTESGSTGPDGGTTGTTTEHDPENRNGLDLTWLIAVVGVFAGVGLIYGQYRLRRSIRKKKMYRGNANDQAIARWKEARRYEKILKKKPPETLLELAEKARFSQHTLTSGELVEFALHLKNAAAELGKRNWAYRLLCRIAFAVE